MQINSEPNRLSPLHTQHHTLDAHFELRNGWLSPDVYTTTEEETATLRDHVGLADISARGKLIIKGSKVDGLIAAHFGESPTKPGNVLAVESNHLLISKLTTDEFLILSSPGVEQEIITSLEAEIASQNTFVSLVDQTSGMVGVSIAGLNSVGLIEKLCALDFNPINFPDMRVAQSSFAKVRTTIIRHDRDEMLRFELYADRSYADYLWNTILDAGMELGIKPVGWVAIER